MSLKEIRRTCAQLDWGSAILPVLLIIFVSVIAYHWDGPSRPKHPLWRQSAETSQARDIGQLSTPRSGRRTAENGSYHGQLNESGRRKTVHVSGYYRKDGTYVQGYYRSPPR